MKNLKKKVLKSFISNSPKWLEKRIFRGKFTPVIEVENGYSLKVCSTIEEYKQAFSLVQNSYKEANISKEKEHFRITKNHLHPSTVIIIVKNRNEVVAAMSIFPSRTLTLPMESLWDLSSMKQRFNGAEVSSLAVKKEYRKRAGKILFPIMYFAYEYTQKYMGINCFFISINPATSGFYEHLFHFRFISKEIKRYKYVNNAPAIGMYLDFNEFNKAGEKGNDIFYKNVLALRKKIHFMQAYHFPKEKYYSLYSKVITPQFFKYFFEENSNILDQLTRKELEALKDAYNFDVFSKEELGDQERSKRFFIYAPAQLISKDATDYVDFKIQSITPSEIQGQIDGVHILKDQNLNLKIDISRLDSLSLQVQITHLSGSQVKLEFIPTPGWQEFYNFIQEKAKQKSEEVEKLDDWEITAA